MSGRELKTESSYQLIGRYSANDIAAAITLTGSVRGLARFAEALLHAPSRFKLTSPVSDELLDLQRVLEWAQIVDGNGKVVISRQDSTLVVSGSDEFRSILAENVAYVALTNAEPSPETSTHLHVEYFPDHFYLDERSAALIIECSG